MQWAKCQTSFLKQACFVLSEYYARMRMKQPSLAQFFPFSKHTSGGNDFNASAFCHRDFQYITVCASVFLKEFSIDIPTTTFAFPRALAPCRPSPPCTSSTWASARLGLRGPTWPCRLRHSGTGRSSTDFFRIVFKKRCLLPRRSKKNKWIQMYAL